MLLFLTQLMLIVHTFVGVILIGIILLQRGRGGGLAGAFGGMGGQSAFGTKAGDVFTKITIWIATIWIVLGCVCVLMTSNFKSGPNAAMNFKPGVAADLKKAPPEGDKKDSDKKADEDNQPPPAPDSVKDKPETKSDATKPESKDDSSKPEHKVGPEKPAESKPDTEPKSEKENTPAPGEPKKDGEAPKDTEKKD